MKKIDPNNSKDLETLAEFFSFLNATGVRAVMPPSIKGMLLQNALSAGFGDPNVLNVESLEAVLRTVTFDAKDIKLWNSGRPKSNK